MGVWAKGNCYNVTCRDHALYNGLFFCCVMQLTVDAQNTPTPLIFMVIDHSPNQMLQLLSFVYSLLIFFRDHCTFLLCSYSFADLHCSSKADSHTVNRQGNRLG